MDLDIISQSVLDYLIKPKEKRLSSKELGEIEDRLLKSESLEIRQEIALIEKRIKELEDLER